MDPTKDNGFATRIDRGLFGKVQRINFDGAFSVPRSFAWGRLLEALARVSRASSGAFIADFAFSSRVRPTSTKQILSNIRGYPVTGKNHEILFRAEGTLTSKNQQTSALPATSDSKSENSFGDDHDKPDRFFYELQTRFLDFQGGNIRSELELQLSASLTAVADELSPLGLGQLSTAELGSVYFGWQYFKPKLLGASFGVAPVETSEVEIFGNEGSLSLRGFTTSADSPETAELLRATKQLEDALRLCEVSHPLSHLLKEALS